MNKTLIWEEKVPLFKTMQSFENLLSLLSLVSILL